MWHASVSGSAFSYDWADLVLQGVGSALLGEWSMNFNTGAGVHLRRRCTAKEQKIVGAPKDIRQDEKLMAKRWSQLSDHSKSLFLDFGLEFE